MTSPWLFRRAQDWGDPVNLVPTPEEWTVDACHRACILQPDIVELDLLLQRIPIRCSEAYEAWLRATVTQQVLARLDIGRPNAANS